MPFYVAAPLSTIDLATPHGGGIPIEERPAREVTHVGGVAGHAGRRQDPQSGLRRHAGALHHRRSSPRRASPVPTTPPACRDCSRRPRRSVRGTAGGRRLLVASPVLILGVESSCDETAAAVVEETGAPDKPWRVRSNVIASQVALHREWGGVVPELASRQHLRDICGVARAGAGRRRRRLARSRRGRGHAGAGPGRLAAGRPAGGQVGGAVARPAAGRRPSPRRPHRVADPAQRAAAAAGGRARRLGRPHQPLPDAGRRRVPPDRPHPRRRGGGGLRQGRQAARPRAIRAGR